MQISLRRKFDFEAAQHLPSFPEGHKCRRMHGHSFQLEVV
ncbi:MAG: 6-pyruvoyl tetrahydropterin synthase, partial [Verrucomicrobia bacterium]|nr:6-pyruvoyl tetrahydropterin synthase [Verrucomicrobiota bacterium]